MEVQRIAVKALLVITPGTPGGTEGAEHLIVKSHSIFQICLTRMEQVEGSILAVLGELRCV